MRNRRHALILLRWLLVLGLARVVDVRDVGVGALEYFVDLRCLLHGALRHRALTRLSRQL